RLQNRVRQLKLATRPDGTVHGGPDRATGDPRTVNENSAMYGSPDDIAKKLEELRDAGAGYVLINGGGSGGGARGRESLRRSARAARPRSPTCPPGGQAGRPARSPAAPAPKVNQPARRSGSGCGPQGAATSYFSVIRQTPSQSGGGGLARRRAMRSAKTFAGRS